MDTYVTQQVPKRKRLFVVLSLEVLDSPTVYEFYGLKSEEIGAVESSSRR